MDYTGVFDFQLFWSKKVGLPIDRLKQCTIDDIDIMAEWFNGLKDGNLNNKVCVDAGRVASEFFDDIEKKRNELIIHGSNDSDLEDMLRVRLIPKTMEVVLCQDPRMSYAALCPKYNVLEIDSGTWQKDRGQRCVLFYPHSSLLMTKEHKTAALSNLGIHYEQPGFSNGITDLFESDWKDAIVDRVKNRVLPKLKNHYASVSLYNIEFGDSAPCEGSRGNGIATNDAVFTFFVERSKGMKNRNLSYWAQQFFNNELPFYSRVWCEPTNKPRHSKLSVLVELPE